LNCDGLSNGLAWAMYRIGSLAWDLVATAYRTGLLGRGKVVIWNVSPLRVSFAAHQSVVLARCRGAQRAVSVEHIEQACLVGGNLADTPDIAFSGRLRYLVRRSACRAWNWSGRATVLADGDNVWPSPAGRSQSLLWPSGLPAERRGASPIVERSVCNSLVGGLVHLTLPRIGG
jgi:hypothetical protein